MSRPYFDESAPWSLDIPKQQDPRAGYIYYHQGKHVIRFEWELEGGRHLTSIWYNHREVAVPRYVLERVAHGYQTQVLAFPIPTLVEFREDQPGVIRIIDPRSPEEPPLPPAKIQLD